MQIIGLTDDLPDFDRNGLTQFGMFALLKMDPIQVT